MPGIGMGLGLWKSGGGNVTPLLSTVIGAMNLWYNPTLANVTLNVDRVSGVANLGSTASANLEQSTAANQVLYTELHSAFNNKPVLEWEAGNNDFLATAGTFTGINQPCTWFFVARCLSPTVRCTLIENRSGASRHIIQVLNSPSLPYAYAGASLSFPAFDSNVFALSVEFNGASSKVYRNGVEIASGSASTQGCASLVLGMDQIASPGYYWRGEVAQVALQSGAAGATKQAAFYAWARQYYGAP